MKPLTLISLLAVLAVPAESFAQGAGPPSTAPRPNAGSEVLTRDTLSASDLKRIAEQIDQWKRIEGNGELSPREAKARTAAMLNVLQASCVVSDAAYRGKAPDAGAQIIYEAACEDGNGYLLMLGGSTLSGISCLARSWNRLPMECALPANVDSKVMASALLERKGVECKVRELKWLGTSAANLEHIEADCESGGSYVMRSPPLGTSGKLEVFDCEASAKQGVACELSARASPSPASADARPTLSWFKEALGRNGVSCLTKRARIVGRESIKRRYLVEFECSDRPEGLVAFVPPAGDTVNTFETMSCQSAAERGIQCALRSKDQ